MITLEFAPDLLAKGVSPGLNMNSQASDDQWEESRIEDETTGQVLGWARQKKSPRHMVRFFYGKGGFSAVITRDDLVYFGLPGSHICLDDTEVKLLGDPIQGKPGEIPPRETPAPRQRVTPQAMILGAGLATRFEPVSGETTGYPKPGVPLVGHDSVIVAIAKLLRHHGISTLLVNTFYKPDSLKAQLNAVEGITVKYLDESAPSGTAGGLLKAFEAGLVDLGQPIIIIQGDAITDADLSFLLNTHHERRMAVTIGGQIVPDRDVDKYGIIETDGEGHDGQSGNITSFKEKPSLEAAGKSRFANAGFYILAPEVFDLFRETGRRCMEQGHLYDYAHDFFPAVLAATRENRITDATTHNPMGFWAQAVGGYWSDVGNPTQYIESLHDIYEGRVELDLPDNPSEFYENGIIYWPGAKARAQASGAELTGNVVVALKYQ